MNIKIKEIKNTDIAIGFFGISYMENYNHWMNWKTNPDWRKTNYKDTLYKILSDSNNKINHFFSTYYSKLENELLKDLSPKAYKFNEFTDNSWVNSRHNRFKETLDLFTEEYEYYILTRFDLSFKQKELIECNICKKHINVTSKHGYGTNTELLCDYFYIFDNSMLNIFKTFIHNLPPDNGDYAYYHKLHTYKNAPNFSYMIEGSYYSHNCPVWTIIR
jgi:hypothetical protein